MRQLTEEVLDSARRIEKIIGQDDELAALWHRYLQASVYYPLYDTPNSSKAAGLYQSYLEFSVRTPRYRLAELGVKPRYHHDRNADLKSRLRTY